MRRQQAADERKAEDKINADIATSEPASQYDRFQILALAQGAQAGQSPEGVVTRATVYEKYLNEGATA